MQVSNGRYQTSADRTNGKVLVVGGPAETAHSLVTLFELGGYQTSHLTLSMATVEILVANQIDLVVLLEVHAPATAMGWSKSLRADPRTHLLPLLVVSERYRRDLRSHWVEAGADDYLCLLFDVQLLLARVRALLARRTVVASERHKHVALTLFEVQSIQQPDTAEHARRVAALSLRMGKRLGLGREALVELYFGALLHDIGKLAVSPAVLSKAGTLSNEEWACMRQHPLIGVQLLQRLELGCAVAPIVCSHHERMDGSGYPHGLVGTAIPLSARIVAVADAFDAMTNPRPYRQILTQEAALAQLAADAERHWDGNIVRTLAALLRLPYPSEPKALTVDARLVA